MMQRRDALKVMAGAATLSMAGRIATAVPSKVRVTLVRWPYT